MNDTSHIEEIGWLIEVYLLLINIHIDKYENVHRYSVRGEKDRGRDRDR